MGEGNSGSGRSGDATAPNQAQPPLQEHRTQPLPPTQHRENLSTMRRQVNAQGGLPPPVVAVGQHLEQIYFYCGDTVAPPRVVCPGAADPHDELVASLLNAWVSFSCHKSVQGA